MSPKIFEKVHKTLGKLDVWVAPPIILLGSTCSPVPPVPCLCHTVKSSQSQLVTMPLYKMVNSSHDFRWFEGVTSWPCDELTGSHSPAITLACCLIRSNTKPPHFHNFVAYSTQVCNTAHLWKDRQHYCVESCTNCIHNIGKPMVNPTFVKKCFDKLNVRLSWGWG